MTPEETEPQEPTEATPATVTREDFDNLKTEFGRLLEQKSRLVVEDSGEFATCLDTAKFEQIQRLATLYSNGTIVPDQFQGSVANCYIGIQMALRCGVDPLMFLQKCYIVHGRPGIEATLAIALANKSGVFKHRLSFALSGEGDRRQCVCTGIIADTGETVEETVSVKDAKNMGWWNKKGSLWPAMTDLLLRYRSAMWLIRTTCPEVIMGMQSNDELRDIESKQSDNKKTKRSSLNDDSSGGDVAPLPLPPLPEVLLPADKAAQEKPKSKAKPKKKPPAFDWGPLDKDLEATTAVIDADAILDKYAMAVPDPTEWVKRVERHKAFIVEATGV